MTEPSPQHPSFAKRLWSSWIKPVGGAVIVVMTLRSAVADWNDVPSQSMEPTILVGDRIFVNKLAYDLKVPFTTWHLAEWADPERGDIVIFFAPGTGKRMVKRVAGLPGDSISIRNGMLYVNGTLIEYESYIPNGFDPTELTDKAPFVFALEKLDLGGFGHTVMAQPARRVQRNFGPITVPEGHFFMLGDNRDNSVDSRVFGPVPRSQIVGKATALAFSLDQQNSYAPRWNRFFRGLD
jgi:signal peptidase I